MILPTSRELDGERHTQRRPADSRERERPPAQDRLYPPQPRFTPAAPPATGRERPGQERPGQERRRRGAGADARADREALWQSRQQSGLNALIAIANAGALANANATTQALPLLPASRSAQSPAATTGPQGLVILKDPAMRGAVALILSAVVAGGLGFVFWAVTARYQSAAAVGIDSAEVSAITFLSSVGSLNLINVFARFLPEAGWLARRMIIVSYAAAVLAGLVASLVFLMTPLASGLVLGGNAGRVGFTLCVVLNSVFMIQDGGLVGFGRPLWVPVENIAVAVVRLAALPVSVALATARIGTLWAWAIPMAVSVVVVNVLNIGVLARREARKRPQLPPVRELGHFIAIESVTTAVSAAVSAFLPALVTRRLGAAQGGYFYVPWIITTMASLLLVSILISMVREAVARPQEAQATIRRSMQLIGIVMVLGTLSCVFLAGPVLTPMGHAYAVHGAPLLRWVGFALPAMAVNLLFWSTCLVRKRPWPVFGVNLTTSVVIIAGVLLLKHGAQISRVGEVYCVAQWLVAVIVAIPTVKALRAIVPDRQE